MKNTIAAENQFAECAEGMLKLPPRPTRVMASGISLKGRNRPAVCLMVLTISGSPRQITSTSMMRQTRPRMPALQTKTAATTIKNGTNSELPLKKGMQRSKSGLLNVSLMNRNMATSSECSQDIARILNVRGGYCQED